MDSHQAIQSLYKIIKELPITTIRFKTTAKRLLKNNDGRIDRVLYESEGAYHSVLAKNLYPERLSLLQRKGI